MSSMCRKTNRGAQTCRWVSRTSPLATRSDAQLLLVIEAPGAAGSARPRSGMKAQRGPAGPSSPLSGGGRSVPRNERAPVHTASATTLGQYALLTGSGVGRTLISGRRKPRHPPF